MEDVAMYMVDFWGKHHSIKNAYLKNECWLISVISRNWITKLQFLEEEKKRKIQFLLSEEELFCSRSCLPCIFWWINYNTYILTELVWWCHICLDYHACSWANGKLCSVILKCLRAICSITVVYLYLSNWVWVRARI